ncbi:ergothioneine biosynthesis protein EgtC [Streptomyces clavuligerus]|uniref:ergothioneine biosynthesis protein EgtC n=1 Tax=Streptomyces clavuligerus TaxID=1901 RepID=UPI000810AB8D|nr:ergothioneine biosynthesis protein EgtC [Streptomyces clavuligerus]ANW17036.1 ergothioneine biosynthesis protein EgtC [Streptomyces clavuligerus]AXU11571.1 ergothioneine biosynthesis protein EgtC [Streptomyces clavuligerus]QPL61689.1 ergothioneine biosynthesis protein EgtC [Streptomyces clavuligerus]QPL67724.1 ergothioneine biosynthesis protein EgtC [Streptomyces clavuligerus]QPL73798.1 ergothioneine biosynthesis protein EgtC [Streptomyces clavuligerus]
MCRHIARIGPPLALGETLTAPPHGLLRQSWAPRRQRHGTVNADGFGVGWYADGDPVPARYRRAGPVWGDLSFADLVRVVRSGALLAAVRDATEPGADDEAAAAPFAAGPWLFSHNGAVPGWPGVLAPLARTLPTEELLGLAARCDAALLWALALRRLRAGEPPGRALADTVVRVAGAAPDARLNFLLTDGVSIAATTWGDSLWWLAAPDGGTVVASEPYDDDPHWREVPDRTLLVASRADVQLSSLKEPLP